MKIKFYNRWNFEYFPKSFWFTLFDLDWEFISITHSFSITVCNFELYIGNEVPYYEGV